MRLGQLFLILIVLGFAGWARGAPTTQPYLLHIPGIGGHLPLDDHLLHGLRDGGINGWLDLYDWTGPDRGVMALLQERRHERQSSAVAELLINKFREHPDIQITLTSHSGGCGIAAWALEKLPDDVIIDNWVQMQSALSPTYDLTKALRHVRRAYALYSPLDSVVLGTGTRTLGTVDGEKSDAAGLVGYTRPAGGDPRQYDKLRQYGYDESWMRFDDIGDHIGPMTYRFARFMIAPMLKTGKLPAPPFEPLPFEPPPLKPSPFLPATTQATPTQRPE
jgi:hypothetical protein